MGKKRGWGEKREREQRRRAPTLVVIELSFLRSETSESAQRNSTSLRSALICSLFLAPFGLRESARLGDICCLESRSQRKMSAEPNRRMADDWFVAVAVAAD